MVARGGDHSLCRPPDSHAPVLGTAARGRSWGTWVNADGAGFLALAPGPSQLPCVREPAHFPGSGMAVLIHPAHFCSLVLHLAAPWDKGTMKAETSLASSIAGQLWGRSRLHGHGHRHDGTKGQARIEGLQGPGPGEVSRAG